jgi:hypothetical protein
MAHARSLGLIAITLAVLNGCASKSTGPAPGAGSTDRAIAVSIAVKAADSIAADSSATAGDARNELVPIGQLKGRQHTLMIYSSQDGPRFTVVAADGTVMAEQLSVDQLRAQLPEVYESFETTIAGSGYLASVGVEPVDVIDASSRPSASPR